MWLSRGVISYSLYTVLLLCNRFFVAECLSAIRPAGDPMYLLRLFLMAWFAVGVVTVFFLFLLCKRTAAAVKEPGGFTSFSHPQTDFGANSTSGEVRTA
jgi:hypothetical protein